MRKYWKFNENAPNISEDQLEFIYNRYEQEIQDHYAAYNGVLSLGDDLLNNDGIKRFSGYAFDMRHSLNCYIISSPFSHNQYYKVWAKNKTAIRRIISGKIKIAVCPKEFL